MLEILILSITQGITEFLPVSSSAHLILISKYFNNFNNNENLILDVSLHLGSLLAVIYFFKKEILNFIQNKILFIKILIGSFPTMIVGFFLIKLNLIDQLRNIYIIGVSTIFFGLLLYFSDNTIQKKNLNDLNFRDIIYIGLFQILSLIPGVSRSGITITGARFFKFDRVNSAKISFLLSIPTLTVVCAYNILKIIEMKDLEVTIQNFWGAILAFIFSFLILKFLINYLKKFTLTIFIIYRIVLGIIIIIYAYN